MGDLKKYIQTAEGWLGAKAGDPAYSEMLRIFNTNKQGYRSDTENCCEFTVSCALKAFGLDQKYIPVCNYANGQAKMWKKLTTAPSVGSLAYFDYQDGKGISHVEIVTDVTPTEVKTINGNSNHKVVRVTRKRTYKYFAGFGKPDWPKEEVDMTKWQEAAARQIVLKKGSVGTLVRWLQQYLQSEGFYKNGSLDGIFGSYMQQAVKDFQRASAGRPKGDLYVDGIVGWNTWNYILK